MVYVKCLHNVLGFRGLFGFFFGLVLGGLVFFPFLFSTPDNNIPVSGEFSTVISQTLTYALYITFYLNSLRSIWLVKILAFCSEKISSISDIPICLVLPAFLSKIR